MVDKACRGLVPTSLGFKCFRLKSVDIIDCKNLEKVPLSDFCVMSFYMASFYFKRCEEVVLEGWSGQ